MKIGLMSFMLVVFCQCRCSAQVHHSDSTSQNFSPYNINSKNELKFFSLGLGLVSSGLILKSNSEYVDFTDEELSNLNRSNVNLFDRFATKNKSELALTISDVVLYSSFSTPLIFCFDKTTKQNFGKIFIMSLEVSSITNALVFNAKFAFNRTRPLAYNPNFSLEHRKEKTNKLSFFSGHTAQTSSIFVFTAKVLNDFYPKMSYSKKVALWSSALTIPAFTGFLRVKGGKHYPTDVVTGYVVGTLTGWLIPHLHKTKINKLSILPYSANNSNGLILMLHF